MWECHISEITCHLSNAWVLCRLNFAQVCQRKWALLRDLCCLVREPSSHTVSRKIITTARLIHAAQHGVKIRLLVCFQNLNWSKTIQLGRWCSDVKFNVSVAVIPENQMCHSWCCKCQIRIVVSIFWLKWKHETWKNKHKRKGNMVLSQKKNYLKQISFSKFAFLLQKHPSIPIIHSLIYLFFCTHLPSELQH